ncbi:hypothetical protein [Microbacterium sp.]|uniref:hypothetical protein n=1 Tax=Microbacterium sp. TaxID=51671 RepID=UPI0026337928|nr:hypothetical protein [Microbacterium sp.]
MFEHPSFTYTAYVTERQRIDRENELRRVIAEHPERIVSPRHPFVSRIRELIRRRLGEERRDSAAVAAAASERSRRLNDSSASAVHAR